MLVPEQTMDRFTRIAEYYATLIRKYGHDPRACDYGRAESQQLKFRVLADVMVLNNSSVLDVGCGFGDFAEYLEGRFVGLQYHGIDLCPDMITEAKRHHPQLDLRVANITELAPDRRFDVVIANGIFYLLGEDAVPAMQEMISRMFSLATTAVAFNSLSAWAQDQEPGEFYADPLRTVEFCRRLTPCVAMRHDYHSRDFTVYLYKSARI